jgi:predicted transcriptional regulator
VVDASSTRASVEKYIREEVARQIKEKSDRTEKVAKITATVEKIGLPQEFEIGTTPKKKPKDKRVKEGS